MTDPLHQHETFTIERFYPNGRDDVWAAWAEADKKRKWFGGESGESDFRVGGTETKEFSNDMGTHTNNTQYFDIKDRERIVFAYSMAVNGTVHTVSLATVALADDNGGTRLTYTEQMCIIPPSDGAKGRTHGWNALLDSLGKSLAQDTISGA